MWAKCFRMHMSKMYLIRVLFRVFSMLGVHVLGGFGRGGGGGGGLGAGGLPAGCIRAP